MKIHIDNISYEVTAGKNLLDVCIGLGLNLPYFCYHPAMGSVGACRQCAVKKYANAADEKGKIIMACMEPVTDGMIVSINDKEASQFRAGIIEGLMLNHPHDCPICDEGGECHLQDMTVMTGHNYRRYDFRKRTYISQELGPFIHHEMNRCIQCYRCVRFYRDYAGGKDLNVFGSASLLYFGRKEDGVLESEFSGNLVEVCPTGVFTDKTLQRHYARKWDLTNAPSVCVHCSVGCNTMVGERYGMVRRVLNRYHPDINGYFLCDRGRFGYEFVNHPLRMRKVVTQKQGITYNGPGDLKDLLPGDNQKKLKIAGIGSPRASLESNYALMTLVGKERFFSGTSAKEHRLTRRALDLLHSSSVKAASLKDIEKCDAALILNEDVTQTAPVMALSIRTMTRYKAERLAEKSGIPPWNDSPARELAQDVKSPLYIAHPYTTKLDDTAKEVLYYTPEEIARLGFTVAAIIDQAAPEVPGVKDTLKQTASNIAADLLSAERPLIVTGIAGATDEILDAVSNIIVSLSAKNKKPWLAVCFPENNSVGIASMKAGNIEDAIDAFTEEPADILIILENDLYRRTKADRLEEMLGKQQKVIVIDHLMHETAKKAHAIFPAAVWAESTGTIVNHEGRAQRYYPVLPHSDPVKQSWQWIIEFMNFYGLNGGNWMHFDDVAESLARYSDAFSGLTEFHSSGFRVHHEKVARQTMRFSGRTAIYADITVNEPKPPEDGNSPLKFSMEGYKGQPPATLIPYYWAPGWNSNQAVNKYLKEPNGPLRQTDPGMDVFIRETTSEIGYIKPVLPESHPQSGTLYLVPFPVIFGSEELSSHGQAIAELIAEEPFLKMNNSELSKYKTKPGQKAELQLQANSLWVMLQNDNTIPDGLAALSVMLPGMNYIELPATAKLIVA